MAGGLEYKFEDDGRLEAVIANLQAAKEDLPVEVRKALKELAGTLAHEASLRVLAEPTHGDKHTGLRAKVAAGVGTTEIPDGERITTEMPHEDEAIIPRGFDTAASRRGWRHPLFGNREKWYRNYGGFSWFLGAMQDGNALGEARLKEVMDQIAKEAGRS